MVNENAKAIEKEEIKKVIADGYLKEELFRCKTCSTEQDAKWYSWTTATKEPIEADEDKLVTRAALFCKDCQNQFGIYTIISLPEVKRMLVAKKLK